MDSIKERRKNTLLESFARYAKEVEEFCPFLRPANNAQLISNSVVSVVGTNDIAEPLLLAKTIIAVEQFRHERRSRNAHERALLCTNLIFDVPKELGNLGRSLFEWSWFALKLIYTSKAVVFGWFPKGEYKSSRDGRPLPVPPVDFFSIRSKVERLDRRFFHIVPELMEYHIAASDDGADVLLQFFNGDSLSVMDADVTALIGPSRDIIAWAKLQWPM